jgi:hypothetical protein
VRTRTLLLLAVATGLVILVAGVVQLLRIADESDAEGDESMHALGEEVEVGDLTVVVESYDESGGVATLDVTLGGVDDPDGADEFRLVVPGESLSPTGAGEDACGATTVASQSCVLEFDMGEAPGGARILLYRRGDDVARWELEDAAGGG